MRTSRRSFLLAVLLLGATGSARAGSESLTDVKAAVEKKTAYLVDVREIPEWKAGHLRDARSMPLSELRTSDALASSLPKGKPVYLHCVAGVRARKAAEILGKLGYDARALDESYAALVKAGFADAGPAGPPASP